MVIIFPFNKIQIKMKKITLLLFACIAMISLNSCEDNVTPTGVNYVTFEAATFAFGVDIGSSNTRDIKIYTANISGSDRTFTVNVVAGGTTADPASYTVPTTVTVPANSNVGTVSVSVSDINIGAGQTLELAIEAAPGLFAGPNIVLNISQVCPWNDVSVKLEFDQWPEEASYVLMNAGGVVDSTTTGAFASAPDNSDWTKSFCLQDGAYTFTINDSYGDGGTTVTITTAAAQYTISGASYNSTASVNFTLP